MAKSGLDGILERTSIRHFKKNKKIPKHILEKILLAGIRAPSAGNIQPRTFIICQDQTVRDRLYELCEDQAFMKDAPVWIVVCVDLHRHLKATKVSGVEYDYTGILPYTFGVLDAALSLENMVIAAETLELGSVIIGSVIEHPAKVQEILKLPEHCVALSLLCIGYPQKKRGMRNKWNRDVIVSKDYYKDIKTTDVSRYWKEVILGDLKRSGKEISKEIIEKVCRDRNYGRAYADHYKEEFIRTTNKKLTDFLRRQGFLKD